MDSMFSRLPQNPLQVCSPSELPSSTTKIVNRTLPSCPQTERNFIPKENGLHNYFALLCGRFSPHNIPEETRNGLPVAPLPHDSRSLRSPVFSHPIAPCQPWISTTLTQRFNSLTGTVWTAFRRIKDVLSNSILSQKPLAKFAIAIPHNWDKVIVQAVRSVLQHPLKFTEERLEELKRISGTGHHNLLFYHRLCGNAVKKTLTFAFHNPMTRHMSDFPFGAAASSGRSPPFFPPTPFFGDEYWMVLLPASWTVTRSATKSKSRRAMI